MRKFLRNRDGVTGIEYSLIAAVMVSAITIAVPLSGSSVQGVFSTLTRAFKEPIYSGGNLSYNIQKELEKSKRVWTTNGELDGWKSSNGIESGYESVYLWGSNSKEKVIELDTNQNSSMSRNFDLLPGEKMKVSLDAAMRHHGRTDEGLEVLWNGKVVGDIKPGDKNRFRNYAYEVQAGTGDGSNKLTLRSTGVSNGTGVVFKNLNTQLSVNS